MAGPDDFLKIKKKLDGVSPSFCLAKWTQVSLHLQNGTTHSCHHPIPHRVPEGEVAKHPDAIHNSSQKMRWRKEMLGGKRPRECEYCWEIEDVSPELVSDRLVKSGEDWALPAFEEIRSRPWNWRVTPSYVEVSFSNTCNFKCAYCTSADSSKWAEELRDFGPIPDFPSAGSNSPFRQERLFSESDPNPYLDAFWKWWPELYPKLKVFRITGGEPLLTKNTFRVLDHIAANPRPDLELAINSNLGVPEKLIERMISQVQPMLERDQVRSFHLYTSIDTWGEQAEYLRFGMHFESFWRNVREVLLRLPRMRLGFMCAFNALSVPRFHLLLDGVLKLKEEFGGERVMIDLPMLRDPMFLSARVLPLEHGAELRRCLAFVEEHQGARGFLPLERVRMERVVKWFATRESGTSEELKLSSLHVLFARFFKHYDRRRNLDFSRVFPELSAFMEACRKLDAELMRGREGK